MSVVKWAESYIANVMILFGSTPGVYDNTFRAFYLKHSIALTEL